MALNEINAVASGRGLLFHLFKSVAPDDNEQRIRIRFMERHTMLPVKAVYFILLVYYLYFSSWPELDNVRYTLFQTIQWFFLLCLVVNTVIGVRFSPSFFPSIRNMIFIPQQFYIA